MVLVLLACTVGGGERSLSFEGVEQLAVRLENGELSVRSVPESVTWVDWSGGGISRDALFEAELDPEGTLWVDAGCGLSCGGELYVEVPEGVPVLASLARGELDVELSAPADLLACSEAGEVDLRVPAGAWDLDLDLGVGELSSSGVSHDPEAEHRLAASLWAGELSVSGL